MNFFPDWISSHVKIFLYMLNFFRCIQQVSLVSDYLQMMTKDTNMNSLSSSFQSTNHSAASLFSDELFNYLNLTNSCNASKLYSPDFQILPSKPTDMSESKMNDAQRPWNNFNSKISFGQLGSPARDVQPKHSLGYLGSSDSLSNFPLGQLGQLAHGADNSFGLKWVHNDWLSFLVGYLDIIHPY